jgi:hypothetical protein
MAMESTEINETEQGDFLDGKTREQSMLYFKVMLKKVFQLIEQHGQLNEDDISAWTSFIYVRIIFEFLLTFTIENSFNKFEFSQPYLQNE